MAHQVKFVLPASFRPFTEGQRTVSLPADSIRAAIDELVTRIPSLKSHLMDDSGNLQPFVNLFVDNKQISDLDTNCVALKDDSEFLIISALAGG